MGSGGGGGDGEGGGGRRSTGGEESSSWGYKSWSKLSTGSSGAGSGSGSGSSGGGGESWWGASERVGLRASPRGEGVSIEDSGSMYVSDMLAVSGCFSLLSEARCSPGICARESYNESVVCPCVNSSLVAVKSRSGSCMVSVRGMACAIGMECATGFLW